MEALAPRSDQLNADDLIAGPRVIKITGARIVRDGRDTKIVINFEGDNGKPWKPCKTMGRAMVMVWGITEPEQLVGKSLRLYRDPEVRFGDQGAVGGIRISHMSHISGKKVVKLTVSQGKKGNYEFSPLVTEVKPGPIDQARNAIANAPDLDALKNVWLSKAMAPFRDQLQADLDARKAALSGIDTTPLDPNAGEKRGDEDMGEAGE
jgi:hypothetical protein